MNSLNPLVIKHNLKFLPPAKKIVAMMRGDNYNSSWVSQKRCALATALKEFRELYDVTEFYASFGKNDDTFKIYYRQ